MNEIFTKAGQAVKNGEPLPLLATGMQGGSSHQTRGRLWSSAEGHRESWCLAGGTGDRDPGLTLPLPSHHPLGPHPHGPSPRVASEGQLRRPTLPASLDLFLPSACTRGGEASGLWEIGFIKSQRDLLMERLCGLTERRETRITLRVWD